MAAGLIAAKLDDQQLDPNALSTTPTTTYKPEQIDLNPATDTVEGRVQELIKANSAPMQLAQTQGLQAANKRGLINSSMAVGEAQKALYGAAVPIAQSDVQSSLTVKGLNQQASNTALQFGAAGVQRKEEAAQTGLITSQLQKERGQIDLMLQGADAETRKQLLAQQGEIDKQLAQVNATNASKLQAERGQIDLQLQTADAANRQALLTRQGEIDAQLTTMRIQGDLQSITAQGAQQQTLQEQRGQIDLQLQTADAATRSALLAQQGAIDVQMAQITGQQRIDLVNQQGVIDTALQNLRGTQAVQLTGVQADMEKQLIAARATADQQLEVLRGQLETGLQTLRGTQAQDLAATEGQYKVLLQTSQSAAVFYSQVAASIGDILAQPDITPENKQTLVNQQLQLLNGGLAVIGGVGNLDLNGLLQPPTGTPPATAPGGTPGYQPPPSNQIPPP